VLFVPLFYVVLSRRRMRERTEPAPAGAVAHP
jgi:hypothetical protein